MKSQIAFRETRETLAGQRVWIAMGITEADPLVAARADGMHTECRIDFAEAGHPLYILFTGDTRPVTSGGVRADGQLRFCAVDEPIKMQIDRVMPSARSNAELFMRETRVRPSENGIAVMAFCGLVCYPETIRPDCDHVYQMGTSPAHHSDAFHAFEGRIGVDVNRGWGEPGMLEATRGKAISAFLREPTWGFESDPVSVRSTLPLATQDMCARHMRLHFADRTRAEEKEYGRLDDIMRVSGLASYRDHPEYERVLSTLVASGLAPDDGVPVTREQLQVRSASMSDAIRDLNRNSAPMTMTAGPALR